MTQSQPQPLNHPYPFQEDGEDSDSDSGRSTVAGEEQFELLDLWRANEMLGQTVKKFGNETVFDEVVVSNMYYVHPNLEEMIQFDGRIFFKWVGPGMFFGGEMFDQSNDF